jgi:hypothetical protein
MPTIQLDGIDFDLALADGSVEDVTVADRDEFLASWPDWFDHEPTDAEIVDFAREHLSDKAQQLVDWPVASEAECNGVSASDFYFSTGWAR